MPSGKIALQLYTVRERAEADLLGTLAEVAEIGYRAVELAGLHGAPADEVRAALDRLGLRAVAAHVQLAEFDTRRDEAFAELRQLGCSYAVVPSLPPELGSPERVEDVARTLDELGAATGQAGLRLAFHNHATELELRTPSGAPFLEALVEATDPALVDFELDVYWAHRADADPARLIERHAGRIALLHLKDVGGAGRDAPVGEGSLPWPGILTAAERANVAWYVVEQDDPEDPLVDVASSLRSLEQMLSARARESG